MTVIFSVLKCVDEVLGNTHVSVLLLVGYAFCYLARQCYRYHYCRINLPVIGERSIIQRLRGINSSPPSDAVLIQEGYEKHGDYAFQFRSKLGWMVCLCDDDLVREYYNAPDDIMSMSAFNEGLYATQYTSPGSSDCVPHVPIAIISRAITWLRTTKSSGPYSYFSSLASEIAYAFRIETGRTNQEAWNELDCQQLAQSLFLRPLCRLLVGKPLCRDSEMLQLAICYGAAVQVSGPIISRIPAFMRPLVARIVAAPRLEAKLSNTIAGTLTGTSLDPTSAPENMRDWLWSWVQKEVPGRYTEVDIGHTINTSIFAAIHTASNTLSSCLFQLSKRPEYVQPLRDEIAAILEKHGAWCKEAVESMTKLDSFIKECQRYEPISPASLHRVAKVDYTFEKNRLEIPKGTWMIAPNGPVLRDERFYESPGTFDGFRFHRLGQASGNPDSYKIAGLSPKSRTFGEGRHTCPGKHIAADILRLAVAYFVTVFDASCGEAASTGMANRRIFVRCTQGTEFLERDETD